MPTTTLRTASSVCSETVWPGRGGLWADRIMVPPFAKLAVEGGHASAQDLERAAAAWRRWAAEEDAWFVMVQGEVMCRVP